MRMGPSCDAQHLYYQASILSTKQLAYWIASRQVDYRSVCCHNAEGKRAIGR